MSDAILYCNRCGAQNASGSSFCSACGAALSSLSPAPADPPAVEIPPPQFDVPETPVIAYTESDFHYGGFWVRFVAALIDGVITSVVVLPVTFLLAAVIRGAGLATGMPEEGTVIVVTVSLIGFSLLVAWLYEAIMESSERQATFGKMAMGLKVTDINGRRITFGRATGRHFAKMVSGMILNIGYIMAGFTDRKQALHDMMAATLVMRTG